MKPVISYDVEVALPYSLVTSGFEIPREVTLRYTATDPFAVSALFNEGGTEVEWVFARSLLVDGLYEPTGDGDLHVWLEIEDGKFFLFMELGSKEGIALIKFEAHRIEAFLYRTSRFAALDEGTIQLDVDSLITALLN